jgi:hypothetical protein
MRENVEIVPASKEWKSRALIVGTVLGALMGASAAYLLIQKSENENEPIAIGPGEGVKLGLTALGLVRQVIELGTKKVN